MWRIRFGRGFGLVRKEDYVIVIIIIIINIMNHPHPSLHSSTAGSQNSTGLTHEALLIHCTAKMFVTMPYVLRFAAVCGRIYIELGGDKQLQAAV
jgi:hypothetical protein